jgi:DNA-binding HxlR family transcriptional regulator
MTAASYKSYCPIAMAAEILCTRWTILILREILLGTSRFNDLRRALPRLSPTLLSKRLKELEAAGIVQRASDGKGPDLHEYKPTEAGLALRSVVYSLGEWGHRWIATDNTLDNLDVHYLMWDMRRNIDTKAIRQQRNTIQITFKDLTPAKRKWWLIVAPGEDVDLCFVDPGFDVDLYLTTDLRTMTEVWMGLTPLSLASNEGRFIVTGDRELAANLKDWMGSSKYANVAKCVA